MAWKEWTPGELYRRLVAGEKMVILDLRTPEEFRRGHIEAPGEAAVLNVPFSAMWTPGDGHPVEAAARFARRELRHRLPEGVPVVAVCYRGNTSAVVAEGLGRAGMEAMSLAGGMEAWDSHYEWMPVEEGEDLAVIQVVRPARGCLSYVLASRGEAVVVDPLRHAEQYDRFLRERGLRLVAVVDTHAHADHLSGGRELATRWGAPYHLHPYDAIHPMDLLPATFPYEPLREGQRLRFGAAALEVLHIPGHTLGNTALKLGERYLLSGDSLFLRSVARPDLGGRAEAWSPLHYRSLRRLASLEEGIRVLPGHFSSWAEADPQGRFVRALGQLRQTHEALRKLEEGEEAFVRYLLASLPEFPPEYVEIKRVNLGLRPADPEEASRLELGKNRCALAQANAAA